MLATVCFKMLYSMSGVRMRFHYLTLIWQMLLSNTTYNKCIQTQIYVIKNWNCNPSKQQIGLFHHRALTCRSLRCSRSRVLLLFSLCSPLYGGQLLYGNLKSCTSLHPAASQIAYRRSRITTIGRYEIANDRPTPVSNEK